VKQIFGKQKAEVAL